MEKTVEELKKAIQFKDSTEVGDVVLMVHEPFEDDDPISATYAVITGFVRDTTKRDEWWHVHLSFLTIPPQPQTLILQSQHFTGREIFTIGGKKVFIQALAFDGPPDSGAPENKDGDRTPPRSGLRVVK